jgi:hypothetical protein
MIHDGTVLTILLIRLSRKEGIKSLVITGHEGKESAPLFPIQFQKNVVQEKDGGFACLRGEFPGLGDTEQESQETPLSGGGLGGKLNSLTDKSIAVPVRAGKGYAERKIRVPVFPKPGGDFVRAAFFPGRLVPDSDTVDTGYFPVERLEDAGKPRSRFPALLHQFQAVVGHLDLQSLEKRGNFAENREAAPVLLNQGIAVF